jgi:hypothetical protein
MTRINTESLPELAGKLRSLEKTNIANVIESGRLLQAAYDRFDHGTTKDILLLFSAVTLKTGVHYGVGMPGSDFVTACRSHKGP